MIKLFNETCFDLLFTLVMLFGSLLGLLSLNGSFKRESSKLDRIATVF